MALELFGMAITVPTRVVSAWNVIQWVVHPMGIGSTVWVFFSPFHF